MKGPKRMFWFGAAVGGVGTAIALYTEVTKPQPVTHFELLLCAVIFLVVCLALVIAAFRKGYLVLL